MHESLRRLRLQGFPDHNRSHYSFSSGASQLGYVDSLSSANTQRRDGYGSGFSLTALKYLRTFYLAYPELVPIGHALRDLFIVPMGGGWKPGQLHAGLSWTHYRTLLKVEQRNVRDFYEIESVKNKGCLPKRADWCAIYR